MHWGDRLSVVYERDSGDVVDFTYNGRYPEPERVDGEALSTLMDDMFSCFEE